MRLNPLPVIRSRSGTLQAYDLLIVTDSRAIITQLGPGLGSLASRVAGRRDYCLFRLNITHAPSEATATLCKHDGWTSCRSSKSLSVTLKVAQYRRRLESDVREKPDTTFHARLDGRIRLRSIF